MELVIKTPLGMHSLEGLAQITLPTGLGEIQVLPDHLPLIGTIEPGVIFCQGSLTQDRFAIFGGVFRLEKNRMEILAPLCEHFSIIDIPRAAKALARARTALEQSLKNQEIDVDRANRSMARALIRLQAAGMTDKDE